MTMWVQLSPGSSKTVQPRVLHQEAVSAPRTVLNVEKIERRTPAAERFPHGAGRRLSARRRDDAIGLMHLAQESDEPHARWTDLAERSERDEFIALEDGDDTEAC